jgi:hypothetical protein
MDTHYSEAKLTPANNNPFAPFIFEILNVKFHIKRLSYSFLQEANDSTLPFQSKLTILENCITKITVDDIEIGEQPTGELLRELLSLDEFMQLCDICFYAQTLNEEQFTWLRMSAWNNTKELDDALQVPCGCALLREADTMSDASAAGVLRDEAPEFQKQWACKFSCYKDEKPTTKALSSITPLSNLTKVKRELLEDKMNTCPKYILSQSWINEAITYYNWRDKGQLNVLFSLPSMFKGVHKEAIDAISNGIGVYEKYHQDRIAKAREQKE